MLGHLDPKARNTRTYAEFLHSEDGNDIAPNLDCK